MPGFARNPAAFCAAFRFAKEPRPTLLNNIVGRASHAKREGAYVKKRHMAAHKGRASTLDIGAFMA